MYRHVRSQLTRTDFEFISNTIGKNASERSAILQQSDDAEYVTEMLHRRELFERSITTPPLFLSISPQLFFYVFVYQALDTKHLADDDVVDYVAGICVEFRANNALWQLGSTEGGKTLYMVDMLNLLCDVDKHRQYFLRRHIGNASLFLTGFFPDFIFKRYKQNGAPGIEYYERIGRSQYETAAESSHAYDQHATPVLNTLADRFIDIRSAINLYTDAYLDLRNRKNSLDMIERQAATLDEESFRQSLDL